MAERTEVRTARGRHWRAAAIGVAVASAAVIVVLSRGRAEEAAVVVGADRCAALVVAWGPAERRALIAGNPEATATAAWLADVIDYRAERWPEARRAACVPPRDRVIECLIGLAPELPAAARARSRSAEQLVALAGGLADPRRCTAPVAATIDAAAIERADAAMIERALAVLRDDGDPRALADYARVLARRAALATEPAEALASAQAALVVEERIYGGEHPALLAILAQLGKAQRELGQLDDALASFARAREIAVHRLPAEAAPRIRAMIDHARALGERDPAGGLASLDLIAAQSRVLAPALRQALDAARGELRSRRASP